jgi:hypothetical protein
VFLLFVVFVVFMIAGISMHQPSSAGAHHLPTTLDHHSGAEQLHTAQDLGYADVDNDAISYGMQLNHAHHHHYEPAAAQQPVMQHHDTGAMNGAAASAHHQPYLSNGIMQQQPQHPGIMVLEQQFARFGIQQEGPDQLANSAHNDSSDNNDTEHNEGEDLEEEPVKLFVGQVRDIIHGIRMEFVSIASFRVHICCIECFSQTHLY